MIYTIGKHFSFEASHQLLVPPADGIDRAASSAKVYGKCSQLHGHTYRLTVEITGQIGDAGWITNFSEVKELVNEVIDQLDHHHLNEIITTAPPTAENIALYIAQALAVKFFSKAYKLYALTLYETEKSFARIIL